MGDNGSEGSKMKEENIDQKRWGLCGRGKGGARTGGMGTASREEEGGQDQASSVCKRERTFSGRFMNLNTRNISQQLSTQRNVAAHLSFAPTASVTFNSRIVPPPASQLGTRAPTSAATPHAAVKAFMGMCSMWRVTNVGQGVGEGRVAARDVCSRRRRTRGLRDIYALDKIRTDTSLNPTHLGRLFPKTDDERCCGSVRSYSLPPPTSDAPVPRYATRRDAVRVPGTVWLERKMSAGRISAAGRGRCRPWGKHRRPIFAGTVRPWWITLQYDYITGGTQLLQPSKRCTESLETRGLEAAGSVLTIQSKIALVGSILHSFNFGKRLSGGSIRGSYREKFILNTSIKYD
ncbi:hypothetical protein DFH06DRAFT_1434480 [Mycena polygramma]|nr:hypothetical protein DFH06DRAFT_1434480 [Mycena polygramma]